MRSTRVHHDFGLYDTIHELGSPMNIPRTGQIDPSLSFKIGPVNERKARESGLWLKARVAPRSDRSQKSCECVVRPGLTWPIRPRLSLLRHWLARTASLGFIAQNVVTAAETIAQREESRLCGTPASLHRRNRAHCERSATAGTRTNGSRRSCG